MPLLLKFPPLAILLVSSAVPVLSEDTNAHGTAIEVTSADGQYHFHLTAEAIEGRMLYPPGLDEANEHGTVGSLGRSVSALIASTQLCQNGPFSSTTS